MPVGIYCPVFWELRENEELPFRNFVKMNFMSVKRILLLTTFCPLYLSTDKFWGGKN